MVITIGFAVLRGGRHDFFFTATREERTAAKALERTAAKSMLSSEALSLINNNNNKNKNKLAMGFCGRIETPLSGGTKSPLCDVDVRGI